MFGMGKLDRRAFAELVAKLAVEEGLGESADVDHDQFRVVAGDYVFNLANVYVQFLELPRRHRKAFVRDNLRAARVVHEAIPKNWGEAAPKLMPRLRDPLFFDGIAVEEAVNSEDTGVSLPPSVALADELIVTYVVDSELTMMTVGHDQLEEWGVSLEQVAEQALRNLQDATETQNKFEELAPGVWLALWNDAYATSRLLLPHVMHQVTTDPIVAVPSRDMLLVAQPRHPGALESMVSILEQTFEDQAYPLSRRLYRLEGKEYVPYPFPQDEAAATRYHNLLRMEAAQRYEEQQAMLQERLGEDIYVASVMLFELADGRMTSFATWTDGVPTLLPEVDQVVLGHMDEDEEASTPSCTVPFTKLLELPGALSKTSHFLARWETKAFPSAALLEEIGEPIEGEPADSQDAE